MAAPGVAVATAGPRDDGYTVESLWAALAREREQRQAAETALAKERELRQAAEAALVASEGRGADAAEAQRSALTKERGLRLAAEVAMKAQEESFARERARLVEREGEGRAALLGVLRTVLAHPERFREPLHLQPCLEDIARGRLDWGASAVFLEVEAEAELRALSALLLSDGTPREIRQVAASARHGNLLAPLLSRGFHHVRCVSLEADEAAPAGEAGAGAGAGADAQSLPPSDAVADLAAFSDALASPACAVSELVIDAPVLSDAAARSLGSGLRRNASVTSLVVRVDAGRAPATLRHIADGIVGEGSACRLQHLDVRCDERAAAPLAVEAIADVVRRCSTLRTLHLGRGRRGGLAAAQLRHLAEAIAESGCAARLEALHVGGVSTEIDGEAGAALATALVACSSLTSLDLSNMRADGAAGRAVSEVGVERLARALERGDCPLRRLNLCNATHAFGEAGMARLSLAVQRNASLEDVNVEFEYDVEDDVIELSPLALVHLDNRPRRRVAIAQHFADSATYHSRAAADVAAVASWSAERRVWAAFPRWCVAETIRQVMA
uniref:Uncharacterized protein n=1 Tax=Bicosoecida sp. CB-2014 TaxID=1486930 RepID=A0A7S1CLV7_9STRA